MRRRSFHAIAGSVVAAAVASLASGCDGTVDTEGMSIPAACNDFGMQLLGDVKLSEAFDSIELAVSDGYGEDESRKVIEAQGTRCATATDAAACEEAVTAALAGPQYDDAGGTGFGLGDCSDLCAGYILVATRGDQVLAVRERAEAEALLGAIDTPVEAVWAVELAGYTFGCESDFGVRTSDDGYEVAATRLTSSCEPVERTQFLLSVSTEATIDVIDDSVIMSESGCVGRRPACLVAKPGQGRTAVGARLAALAHLEAASVPAFVILARELSEHGAPRSLRLAARRAKQDEVRHARDMRRHARRFGGRPERACTGAVPRRALVDIAIENAREGCVREAYGAVVARYQAERARDPALRRTLERIARDEAAHATLALRVDAWARRRLQPEGRARVERARAEALVELRGQLVTDDPGAEVAAATGLPRPAEARALFTAFAAALAAG